MSLKKLRKIGVLTGGGDCPGLNAVIRAVTKSIISQLDVEVIGILDGFEGLIERKVTHLSWDSASGILQRGGTILGTSNKANPFAHAVMRDGQWIKEDVSQQTLAYIEELGLDALICIGGDGTMTISNLLAQKGVPIVGVPKTIDNDIVGTEITFGFDTAVSIATEAIDRLHTTAEAHHRVMLVEIMGRYAGWLTLHAGMAGGADVILIPEIEYTLDAICAKLAERGRRGRRFSIIAVAEGAKSKGGEYTVQRVVKDSPDQLRLGGVSIRLGREIEDRTGIETRATVLGHLQRGGTPTAFDRVLATRYGVAAVALIRKGHFNRMVALQGDQIVSIPLDQVGGKNRQIPSDSEMVETAIAVGTSFGI